MIIHAETQGKKNSRPYQKTPHHFACEAGSAPPEYDDRPRAGDAPRTKPRHLSVIGGDSRIFRGHSRPFRHQSGRLWGHSDGIPEDRFPGLLRMAQRGADTTGRNRNVVSCVVKKTGETLKPSNKGLVHRIRLTVARSKTRFRFPGNGLLASLPSSHLCPKKGRHGCEKTARREPLAPEGDGAGCFFPDGRGICSCGMERCSSWGHVLPRCTRTAPIARPTRR